MSLLKSLQEGLHFDIIVNPYAGRGKAKQRLEEAIAYFSKEHISYSVYKTERPQHAIEYAQILSNKEKAKIIVIGGDGTLHEVINGIKSKADVDLCIVPAGTGNDFANLIGMPPTTAECLDLTRNGNKKWVDVAKVSDGTKAILFISYGVVISIILECRKLIKKTKKSYLKALIKESISYKPKHYSVVIDEKKYVIYSDFISIQNGISAGGGMRICPIAALDDGYFDVVYSEYKGILNRYHNIFALIKGRFLEEKNVHHYRAKHVEIRTAETQYCCLDGELVENEHIVADIVEESYQFYIQ